MTLWRLVLRNVLGSLFRSGAIVACAALVAGLSLSATLVVREAEGGLRRNLSRMGADIQVIPWGTMAPEFDGAHLVGMMTQRWMPRAYLERIARVEGVFNAVVAEGDFCGRIVLEGRGAGAGPTASAVVADLIDIARGRATPVWGVSSGALSQAPAVQDDGFLVPSPQAG